MKAKVLGQKADARARGDISQGRAEEPALAARRRDEAQEHLDESGFARAVGAEEAKDLALAHVQREVGHGDLRSELFAEMARLDGGQDSGRDGGRDRRPDS